jgi:hypothetical protein
MNTDKRRSKSYEPATAMLDWLLVLPRMVIDSGTAGPVGDIDGTCALT